MIQIILPFSHTYLPSPTLPSPQAPTFSKAASFKVILSFCSVCPHSSEPNVVLIYRSFDELVNLIF